MLHKLLFATPLYDNNLADWLVALAVVSISTLGLRYVGRVVRGRLRLLAPRTETLLDDLLLDILRRTHRFFELAVGVWLGNNLLTLPGALEVWVNRGVTLAMVLQLGLWANGVVHYGVVALVDRRSGPEDLAQQSGRNLVRALGVGLVWVLAALFALDNLGVDVSTLVTGLGVTGVALGLAGQQVGSDLFASAGILLDRSILVGDFLITGDKYLGRVERIGILRTHLRSLSGEKIILANSDLAKSRVRNFRTLTERRAFLSLTIEATTPADTVEAVVDDIVRLVGAEANVRLDRAHWAGFAQHGFVLEVVYFVQDARYNVYMDVQQRIHLALLRALEARGVRLAVGLALRPQHPVARLAP